MSHLSLIHIYIEELVSEVTGMFAGGELSEDAIEGAYKALTDAYWIAKENNKKYAPKTRRKKSDQCYLSYTLFSIPVSYTHLDVYKRQLLNCVYESGSPSLFATT